MKQINFLKIFRLTISIGLFMFFACDPAIAQSSFIVETSKGPKELIVPENMTIEDAYVEMFKLYIEERYDYEDLLKSIEEEDRVETTYEIELDNLNDLEENKNNKEEELIEIYEEKTKPTLIISKLALGSTYNLKTQNFDTSVLLGFSFLEKIDIYSVVTFPYSIGFQIGVNL